MKITSWKEPGRLLLHTSVRRRRCWEQPQTDKDRFCVHHSSRPGMCADGGCKIYFVNSSEATAKYRCFRCNSFQDSKSEGKKWRCAKDRAGEGWIGRHNTLYKGICLNCLDCECLPRVNFSVNRTKLLRSHVCILQERVNKSMHFETLRVWKLSLKVQGTGSRTSDQDARLHWWGNMCIFMNIFNAIWRHSLIIWHSDHSAIQIFRCTLSKNGASVDQPEAPWKQLHAQPEQPNSANKKTVTRTRYCTNNAKQYTDAKRKSRNVSKCLEDSSPMSTDVHRGQVWAGKTCIAAIWGDLQHCKLWHVLFQNPILRYLNKEHNRCNGLQRCNTGLQGTGCNMCRL